MVSASTDITKDNLTRILSLAGEIHNLLIRIDIPESWTDEGLPPARVLSGPEKEILQAEDLSGYLLGGDSGPARRGFIPGPEAFDRLLSYIDNRLKEEQNKIRLRRRGQDQARQRIKDLQARRRAAQRKQKVLERRVLLFRTARQDREKEIRRKQNERRPVLLGLEKRLEESQKFLKQTLPSDQAAPSIDRRSVEQLRTEYRSLKSRLQAAQAKDRLEQADLHGKAAQAARLESDLTRCRAQLNILSRYMELAQFELEETEADLARHRQCFDRLTDLRLRLERVEPLFEQLLSQLSLWPKSLSRFGQAAREILAFDQAPFLEQGSRLQEKFEENHKSRTEAVRHIEAVLGQTAKFLEEATDFEAGVKALSSQLDRKTAQLENSPEEAGGIRFLSGQYQALNQTRNELLSRRESLFSQLSDLAEGWAILKQEEQELAERQRGLARKGVAAVRSLATRRGALLRRCNRSREHLAQLYTALPSLIGSSAFIEDCLIKSALCLAEARRDLGSAKQKLAGVHDRLSSLAPADSGLRPVCPDEVEERLNRLKGLNLGCDLFTRLPAQLVAYRAALVRSGRIIRLRRLCGRQKGEMTRLAKDNSRLSHLLGQSRDQLTALSQAREQLLQDLKAAQKQASGLSTYLEDEVRPLVETLSLALYQSQSQNSVQARKVAERDRKISSLNLMVSDLSQGRDEAQTAAYNLSQALWLITGDSERRLADERNERGRLITRIKDLESKHEQDLAAWQVKFKQAAQGQAEAENLNRQLSRHLLLTAGERLDAEKQYHQELADLNDRLKDAKAAYQTNITLMGRRSAKLAKGKKDAEEQTLLLSRALTSLHWERTRSHEYYQTEKKRHTAELKAASAKAADLENRIKELEADHRLILAAHKKNISALNVRAAQLENNNRSAAGTIERLNTSLAELTSQKEESERLFQNQKKRLLTTARAWADRAAKLENRLQDLEAHYEESLALIKNQHAEITGQNDLIAELSPLLAFFMSQIDLWAGRRPEQEAALEQALPQGSEFLVVLIHLLRQENENMKEQLSILAESRHGLILENEHLGRSHSIMKKRLTDLLPVFSYYWQAWFKTTAMLAESQSRRKTALSELTAVKNKIRMQEANIQDLTIRLAKAETDLDSTRKQLGQTGQQKDKALGLARQFRELLARTRAEADELTALRDRMAALIKKQQAGLKSLSRQSQTLELENQRLAAQGLMFWQEADERIETIENLSLQLTDQRGRAEAAWAALAHVASRSREAVAHLQAELTAQAETIHHLEKKLTGRSSHVVELEQTQDKLGLLFWIMAKYGTADEEALNNLILLTKDKGFKDAAAIAGTRFQELGRSALSHLSNENFRRQAARAVRRGFYSLLLAGSMIFGVPQESSKATALPPVIVSAGTAALSRPAIETPVDIPDGPIYCPDIGRPLDISFISPWDKARGFAYVQKIITAALNEQAREVGLGREEFLGLVKRYFKPGQVVSLDWFQNCFQKGVPAFKMIKDLYPHIAGRFEGINPPRKHINDLIRLAATLTPEECDVWDRLFADYLRLESDPVRSLDMVLDNIKILLEQQGEAPEVEFGGRLRPIPELEKLNLTGFTRVITPYLKAHVKAIVSRPAYAHAHKPEEIDQYTQNLARDMYVAGKTFGVPRTMMVSIAHQESFFANVLGDNSKSASPFQIYEPTKPHIIKAMTQKGLRVPKVPEKLEENLTLATFMAAFFISDLIDKNTETWRQDKPLLCDLDRVALCYNGGSAYPGAVHKKKVRLMGYLARLRKIAEEKKAAKGKSAG